MKLSRAVFFTTCLWNFVSLWQQWTLFCKPVQSIFQLQNTSPPCILIKQQTSSFRVKLFSLVYCTTLVNNFKCGRFLIGIYLYATWYEYILALQGEGKHTLFSFKRSRCADQHLKNIWRIYIWRIEVNNENIWLKTWLSKQCLF